MKSDFFTSQSSVESIAIGKFDGLHVAHLALLHRLCDKGALVVIENGPSFLTPKNYREKISPFPIFYYSLEEIRSLEGGEFLELLKKDFPSLKKIVVGYDFMFGKDRSFCAWDVKELYDGECDVVSEVRVDGISVHSGVIKELLKHGNVGKANTLLGREYQIEGKRIKGQGIGKEQLYATINIDANEFLVPEEGVYVTKTTLGREKFKSVSFVGHRVSTDRSFSIETHILEEFEDSGEECVSIEFISKIRENRRFADLDELKKQIESDIEKAKEILE
jgi:riboflavin kinase/FMN adenylyltransferase